MVVIGLGMVVCAVLVVLAPWIRAQDPQVVTSRGELVGTWSVMVLLWLAVLTLATGLTAALHVHPLLRLIGAPVLLLPIMPVIVISGSVEWQARTTVGVVAAALVLVFFLVRIGRRFAWFEFPVMLALVSVAIFVPFGSGQPFGYDFRSQVLLMMLVTLGALAAPALMVTGYAGAQIAVTTCEWSADRANRMLDRPALVVLSLLLAVAAIVRAGHRALSGEPAWAGRVWLGGLVVLVCCLGVCWLLLRLRPRRVLAPVPPDALDNALTPYTYWLAILVTPQLLLTTVGSYGTLLLTQLNRGNMKWLNDLAMAEELNIATRLLAVAVALVIAVRRARRNDRLLPVLLGCYSVVLLLGLVSPATDGRLRVLWTIDIAMIWLIAIVLAMAATLWLREGFRNVIWKQLLLAALLALLMEVRELLSEPAMVFAGVSTTLVVLAGLGWRVFTDGTLLRGDSPGLPQPARVLLFGFSCLLAAVVIAWTSQTRVAGWVDQETWVQLGDHLLGTPLVLAAGIWCIISIYGRLTDDDPGLARFR